MIAHFADWKAGHSPVSTGRALWLPDPFVQAMHYVRSRVNFEEMDRIERNKPKGRGRGRR